MNIQRKVLTSGLVTTFASLMFLTTTPAAADGWELLTTEVAVPGTREIESGDPDEGIQRSITHARTAVGKEKVAHMNNLCVGHILIGQYDQAREYCDEAVSAFGESTVTFNNRGVLNAITGNANQAADDFAAAVSAGCVGKCSEPNASPKDLPRPVARRNQARNAEMIAERKRKTEQEQLASTSQ